MKTEADLHPNDDPVDAVELTSSHPLHAAITEVGLQDGKGTAIAIDDLQFTDKEQLLARERIESYCDWFTVIGDIRSGLFETRLAFHRAIAKGGAAIDGLRITEVELRPLEVHLQVNGERQFTPLGMRRPASDKSFYAAWTDDMKEFGSKAGILMLGHRFADQHTAGVGRGGQTKDDRTALRLTEPGDWVDEHGIAVVARVEGHRRQRETYLEARWQNKKGAYSFDERFGLWLCRDYVPMVQRNDLLRKAIEEAEPRRAMERDFRSLRNWKVFVNDQGCLPIANRGDVSNYAEREGRIYDAVVAVLRRAFQQSDFAEWVEKLRTARRERALSANMSETVCPQKFSVEGETGPGDDDRRNAGDRGVGEGSTAAVFRQGEEQDPQGGCGLHQAG